MRENNPIIGSMMNENYPNNHEIQPDINQNH